MKRRLRLHFFQPMETGIYVGTAVVVIAWSVWTYTVWTLRTRLGEHTAARMFLLAGPSGYFLLIALAAWGQELFIRLDLIGALAYDGLILLLWLVILLIRWLRPAGFRRSFRGALTVFNVLAALLVAAVHLVRLFPPLLIGLTSFLNQGLRFEFFRALWLRLNPESHQNDLANLANKVLIAILSYLPISLIRTVYTYRQINRRQRRLTQEIGELRRRLEDLERSGRSQP